MNDNSLPLLALVAVLAVLVLARIVKDRANRSDPIERSSDSALTDHPAQTVSEDIRTGSDEAFGDYRDWVDQSSWSKNHTADPTVDHRRGRPENAPEQKRRRRQPVGNKASARQRANSKPESSLDYRELASESPLAKLGYRVGRTKGVPEAKRREILQAAFEDFLPNVKSSEYVANWGGPGTTLRHDRICNHLRWQIERSEGNPKMQQAASDWKSDLKWFQSAFGKHR